MRVVIATPCCCMMAAVDLTISHVSGERVFMMFYPKEILM
jgi:hypothetical protein